MEAMLSLSEAPLCVITINENVLPASSTAYTEDIKKHLRRECSIKCKRVTHLLSQPR